MDYQQAVAWLYQTQSFGVKLGLENIRRLLDTIGFRNEQRFLHVAGTNGKGSVCATADAICRAQGLRSGLFTSPHLVTFRERMQINGEMIDEKSVAEGLNRLRSVVSDWPISPTFFELTTALALDFFQRQEVDVVALETGLGGRLDATNAVQPVVSVITPLALDHQAWLGSTLREVATEKAGIIKSGIPVVSAPQEEVAAEVLRETANARGAPISFVEEPLRDLDISLAGSHQHWNAALAMTALRAGKIEISETAISKGVGSVQWPGRFQRLGGVILDGAHNPAAAERLALTWREKFGEEKAVIVLGLLNDKDVEGVCRALLPIAKRIITLPVQSPRTTDPHVVCEILQSLDPLAICSTRPNLAEALREARESDERTLICGSLFLVGEALSLLGESEAMNERSAQ